MAEISRVRSDISKFKSVLNKVATLLKEKEQERKDLLIKKTETLNMSAELKKLIGKLDISSDSDTFELGPEEAEEEHIYINKKLKDGIPWLRNIFCRQLF